MSTKRKEAPASQFSNANNKKKVATFDAKKDHSTQFMIDLKDAEGNILDSSKDDSQLLYRIKMSNHADFQNMNRIMGNFPLDIVRWRITTVPWIELPVASPIPLPANAGPNASSNADTNLNASASPSANASGIKDEKIQYYWCFYDTKINYIFLQIPITVLYAHANHKESFEFSTNLKQMENIISKLLQNENPEMLIRSEKSFFTTTAKKEFTLDHVDQDDEISNNNILPFPSILSFEYKTETFKENLNACKAGSGKTDGLVTLQIRETYTTWENSQERLKNSFLANPDSSGDGLAAAVSFNLGVKLMSNEKSASNEKTSSSSLGATGSSTSKRVLKMAQMDFSYNNGHYKHWKVGFINASDMDPIYKDSELLERELKPNEYAIQQLKKNTSLVFEGLFTYESLDRCFSKIPVPFVTLNFFKDNTGICISSTSKDLSFSLVCASKISE